MEKHTMSDLYQMQSLPLSAKISMTARRINEWVNEFGEDGVYLSFSGGKDSTVLGHIIREVCGYKKYSFCARRCSDTISRVKEVCTDI